LILERKRRYVPSHRVLSPMPQDVMHVCRERSHIHAKYRIITLHRASAAYVWANDTQRNDVIHGDRLVKAMQHLDIPRLPKIGQNRADTPAAIPNTSKRLFLHVVNNTLIEEKVVVIANSSDDLPRHAFDVNQLTAANIRTVGRRNTPYIFHAV